MTKREFLNHFNNNYRHAKKENIFNFRNFRILFIYFLLQNCSISLITSSNFKSKSPSDKNHISINFIQENQNKTTYKKPRIDIILESLCPFCKRFTLKIVKTLLKIRNFESLVDINLHYFGNSYGIYNPKTLRYDFECQHGEMECVGNKFLSCAAKLFQRRKSLEYSVCVFEHIQVFKKDFLRINKYCLRNYDKIDEAKIANCYNSNEGNELFYENSVFASDNKYVPWAMYNYKHSDEEQKQMGQDIVLFLCNLDYNIDKSNQLCDSLLPNSLYEDKTILVDTNESTLIPRNSPEGYNSKNNIILSSSHRPYQQSRKVIMAKPTQRILKVYRPVVKRSSGIRYIGIRPGKKLTQEIRYNTKKPEIDRGSILKIVQMKNIKQGIFRPLIVRGKIIAKN